VSWRSLSFSLVESFAVVFAHFICFLFCSAGHESPDRKPSAIDPKTKTGAMPEDSQNGSPDSEENDVDRYFDAEQCPESNNESKCNNVEKLTPAAAGLAAACGLSNGKQLQQGMTPKSGPGSAGGHGSSLPPSGPSHRKRSPMGAGLPLAPGGGGITPLNKHTRTSTGSSGFLKSTQHRKIVGLTGVTRSESLRLLVDGKPSSGKYSPTSSIASSNIGTDLGSVAEGLSPDERSPEEHNHHHHHQQSGEEDNNEDRPAKKKSRLSLSQSQSNSS